MLQLLSLGAINKLTGEYIYPKIANKKDEYICYECNKDLILCKGEIKNPYFRHKVDNNNQCHNYSNPTETQIHKDGKLLMKHLLEKKIKISFIRNCICCKKSEEFEIPEITEKSNIKLEHRFEFNGVKIADIAYIDDNDLLCIIEICNSHKTSSEKRPEPWFEINAETLIKKANDNNLLSSIQIPCIRSEKCEDCIQNEKLNLYDINDEIIIDKNKRYITSGINHKKYIYLDVEFSRKEMIKEFGGKWNKEHKLWYILKSVYNENKYTIDNFIGKKIIWITNDCEYCNGTGFFTGDSCWYC
jgi:hypothetical protein